MEATGPLTERERARAELAEKMFKFAAENLPEISETDRSPGVPSDWENAKSSLMAHVGVSKYVRVLASVAAQEQFFHLQRFEILRPGSFLDEVSAEMKQCKDAQILELLKTKVRLHILSAKASPGLRAVLWDDAKIYRHNVFYGTKSLIGYCRFIVSEWLEQIPAENFRELSAELERLEAAELKTQLRWFGLAEFLMEK